MGDVLTRESIERLFREWEEPRTIEHSPVIFVPPYLADLWEKEVGPLPRNHIHQQPLPVRRRG